MKPVDWQEDALDRLADMWVQATPAERDEIEAAVNLVNGQLRRAAESVGESRDGDRRVTFCGPLVVHFVVDALRVRVFHVRWSRKRS